MFKSQLNDVEFIEESHTYLIDGVIVPSVSQLLKQVFPNKYQGIPKAILEQKADYGTIVHSAIESHENGTEMPNMNIFQSLALEQYKKLKTKHKFNVKEQETIIHYRDKYAGRFDMTITHDGALCLADIKTTSQLDKEYLAWQLSLYEMAYEYTFNTDPCPFKRFYCIWLPKGDLGQFVEIERISRNKIKAMFRYE